MQYLRTCVASYKTEYCIAIHDQKVDRMGKNKTSCCKTSHFKLTNNMMIEQFCLKPSKFGETKLFVTE